MILTLFSCSAETNEKSEEDNSSANSVEEISEESTEDVSEGSEVPPEDSHWITIGDTEYGFPDANVNAAEIVSDGIYFTNDAKQIIAPKCDLDRTDVVVLDGMISYISPDGVPAIIPNCGGAVITFAGSFAPLASSLSIGDKLKTRKLDTDSFAGTHVTVNGVIYPVNITNGIRAPEGVTALYTPEFGKTTGTNQYGIEIAVSDGKVTAVETGIGNIAIPENGFVLSIHKDAAMYNKSRRIKKGDEASVFSGQPNYHCSLLSITGTNVTRSENALILYMDRSSTQTNPYGFEIAVDENGNMIASGHSGNIQIPKNGFVLSGHGTNEELLENCYLEGGKAVIVNSGKVLVYYAPDAVFINEQTRFAKLEDEYLSLSASFVCDASDEYAKAKAAVEETKRLWESGDIGKAGERFDSDAELLTSLEISLISSPVIENRGTWYRSHEKSEEEVRRIVGDMASMGINTLYLETWYNGSFIGYSDNELIIHSSANDGFDALEAFTRIGHEYGISVHAWVENFFIGTVENQELANKKLANHFDGRWLKDKTGKNTYYYSVSNTNFIFLDPFDPEVRKLLIDFYDEILTKYDVDGIHLDYIRFPELNYGKYDFGYNDDIIKAWQESENTSVDPKTLVSGELYKSWINFRKNIITSYVGEIRDMLDEKHPDAVLSAAVYPEPGTTASQLFQDPAEWVKNGYMDELVSMTYTGDNSYVRRNASSFANIARGKCFYSTGISAFSGTPWDTLIYQPGEARNASADGFSVFSFSYFDISSNLLARTLSQSKSVRTDDTEGMINAISEYYYEYSSLFVSQNAITSADEAKLKDTVAKWKNKCLSLDGSDKAKYLASLLDETQGLKNDVASLFSNKTDTSSAVRQIDRMIHCIEILIERNKAKQ